MTAPRGPRARTALAVAASVAFAIAAHTAIVHGLAAPAGALLALVISKRYGFKMKDDDQDNVRIFRSLENLAAHVAERRTK